MPRHSRPRIAVAVDAALADTARRDDGTAGPPADASPSGPGKTGRAVSHGRVPDTPGDDGRPLEALALMREPAIPRDEAAARSIAVLHVAARDRVAGGVLCVAEAAPCTDLVDLPDLPRRHARPEAWAEILTRLVPDRHRNAGLGPAGAADELLNTAWHARLPRTGRLE
ncbi:inorganic diphosphatase [Streptomyces malaysiensis]|uniref:inorganic diphosphatase n=1 Tax=Streptomyces malaysiensis TaxID=92644 RepID=UPI0033EC04E7